MYRGDIPGFWFDDERGKYFKILPNHVAPEGASYSEQGVKSKKENEEKKQKEAAFLAQRAKTSVKRAPILADYYVSLELKRETALQSLRPRGALGGIWAHFTQRRKLFPASTYLASQPTITAIAEHEKKDGLFIGYAQGALASAEFAGIEFCPYSIQAQDEEKHPHGGRGQVICYNKTNIISLFVTTNRVFVSTTINGTIELIWLYDTIDGIWPQDYNGFSQKFVIGDNITTWSCDASATVETLIAAGTTDGVYLVEMNPDGAFNFSKVLDKKHDVLAVRWHSPNVLLSGNRNGTVRLFDNRVGRSVQALQHPTAVTGIRMADEHRLVAAGMVHQLHTYDLRFLRPALPTERGRYAGMNGAAESRARTAAYISYPGYRNAARGNLGFDVEPGLGLIAAATEEPVRSGVGEEGWGSQVKVFDVWSGREVEMEWGKRRLPEPVRCLLFGKGKEGEGPNLLVGCGENVEEWSC